MFKGWGGIIYKNNVNLQDAITFKGSGLSYSDCNIGNNIVNATFGEKIQIEEKTQTVYVDADVKLGALLEVLRKKKFTLKILPGHDQVSIGGAISFDVHGKLSYTENFFSHQLIEIFYTTKDEEIKSCVQGSKTFNLLVGSMGLLYKIKGCILKISPLKYTLYQQELIPFSSWKEYFSIDKSSTFSSTWIHPCKKEFSGYVFLYRAHSDFPNKRFVRNFNFLKLKVTVNLLSKYTLPFLCSLYIFLEKRKKTKDIFKIHFPLGHNFPWNLLHGKKGLRQLHCIVPKDTAEDFYNYIKSMDEFMTLIVIKEFTHHSSGLLSFVQKGVSICIDFKNLNTTKNNLHRIHQKLAEIGGRVYLAKDCCLSEYNFKKMYPNYLEFISMRSLLTDRPRTSSLLAKRIGLHEY